MSTPERILIIRPSALGDVCRSVPVLASLRRAYPDAAIDWLVQDSFADAIRNHPALTRAVPFERKRLGADLARGRPGALRSMIRGLRSARYDLVLECQGLFRSGLFARATGAPRRVGFANARELGWLGLNERHDVPAGMHTVDRMLELVRQAGVEPVRDMRLFTDGADRAWVRGLGLPEGFVVIAPTSRWPGKRWPADRFAAVAAGLLARGVPGIAVVGSASERDQCGPVLDLAARDPRVTDLIGATSVGRLMATIEASRLVIANDSAALHMAVGFDRPTVALYGPTRVDLVGPYGRGHEVIQHAREGERMDHKDEALGREMMERISVEEALDAAAGRMA